MRYRVVLVSVRHLVYQRTYGRRCHLRRLAEYMVTGQSCSDLLCKRVNVPQPQQCSLNAAPDTRSDTHAGSYFRLLFTVAGVVGPDLPHDELPSLQLTTQPFLDRLGAQRYGTRWRWTTVMRYRVVLVSVRHPGFKPHGVSTHHTVVGVTSAGQHNQQADSDRV